MADLGLLLGLWWSEVPGGRPWMPDVDALPVSLGLPSRQDLAEYYASLTGRSVSDLSFYMTLAVFKLASRPRLAYASYVSGRTNAGFARAAADEVPGLLDARGRPCPSLSRPQAPSAGRLRECGYRDARSPSRSMICAHLARKVTRTACGERPPRRPLRERRS